MPAKSKHMEQRKQRIANAKKNARLAGKLRRRRQLQALGGLLAVLAVMTLAYLWQDGFFKSEEPAAEETSSSDASASESGSTDPSASESASAESSGEASGSASAEASETESE